MAEAMAGFEHCFTRDQSDYFELVTDLILTYEANCAKEKRPTPLPFKERLRHLLGATGWTASDLGRFLGLDATMGNKIVRGER